LQNYPILALIRSGANFKVKNMEIQIQDYPKIIRDKMVDIKKEKAGPGARVEIVDDQIEKSALLVKKVLEEAVELQGAKTREFFVSEIADILEAVESIEEIYNITNEEVRYAMEAKKEIEGGYDGGYSLIKQDEE